MHIHTYASFYWNPQFTEILNLLNASRQMRRALCTTSIYVYISCFLTLLPHVFSFYYMPHFTGSSCLKAWLYLPVQGCGGHHVRQVLTYIFHLFSLYYMFHFTPQCWRGGHHVRRVQKTRDYFADCFPPQVSVEVPRVGATGESRHIKTHRA